MRLVKEVLPPRQSPESCTPYDYAYARQLADMIGHGFRVATVIVTVAIVGEVIVGLLGACP